MTEALAVLLRGAKHGGQSVGNEELRSLEEGLPRLRGKNLERAAKSYTATTRVGCDGFRPEVPPDLSKATR